MNMDFQTEKKFFFDVEDRDFFDSRDSYNDFHNMLRIFNARQAEAPEGAAQFQLF